MTGGIVNLLASRNVSVNVVTWLRRSDVDVDHYSHAESFVEKEGLRARWPHVKWS